MFDKKENVQNIGQAYKCGGIPFYPAQHSFYKRVAGVSEEYIKSRQHHVKDFLKKQGFVLPEDE